jgi:hypothetical protein
MSLILFSFILEIDEPKESVWPTTERALTNNNEKKSITPLNFSW